MRFQISYFVDQRKLLVRPISIQWSPNWRVNGYVFDESHETTVYPASLSNRISHERVILSGKWAYGNAGA